MKYLLIVREIYYGPIPPQAIELNRRISEWMHEQRERRVIESAYYMLPKAGVCIVNVESHEQLLTLLRQWPAYDYSSFEVHALADLQHGIDDNFRRLAQKSEESSEGAAALL